MDTYPAVKRMWIGRLFLAYTRQDRPQEVKLSVGTMRDGSGRCLMAQLKHSTFGVGWLRKS